MGKRFTALSGKRISEQLGWSLKTVQIIPFIIWT
jgi:hypothetical protein